MSIHVTELTLKGTPNRVPAELHDELGVDALFDAEETWAPERVRFLRDCANAGVRKLPQSYHWDWSLKAFANYPKFQLGAFSPYGLFGLKAEGKWQGLLLAVCVGHLSRLPPGKKELVYVDYVEKAPWNWDEGQVPRVGRFKGIGEQLMEITVRWSMDLGFQGRVGLHSLPQSVGFYRDRCGMTELGIDPADKAQLPYFEMSEVQAKAFLGVV